MMASVLAAEPEPAAPPSVSSPASADPGAPAAAGPQLDLAQLIPSKDMQDKISGLFWKSKTLPVRFEPSAKGGMPRVLARLVARYDKAGYTLKLGKAIVAQAGAEARELNFEAELTDQTTTFEMDAFDAKGRIQVERFQIEYEGWRVLRSQYDQGVHKQSMKSYEDSQKAPNIPSADQEAAESRQAWQKQEAAKEAIEAELAAQVPDVIKPKKYYFSANMGYSLIDHKETRAPNYSAAAFVPEFHAQFLIATGISAEIDGFISAVQVGSNRPTANVFFYGADARLGWVAYSGPVRVSLMGGYYLRSMIVADDSFGYAEMNGPQLYPAIEVPLPDGDSLTAFFKFSPVADGFSLMGFENHEIAYGLTYNHRVNARIAIPFSIDVSLINLTFPSNVMEQTIVTFSSGVTF